MVRNNKGQFIKGHTSLYLSKKRITKNCLTCGKEFITYPSVNSCYCSKECIRHSEETKQKIRETNKIKFKGDKNPNWKGGIAVSPYSINWTETLKRSIRERDNYICQLCSQYGNT